MAGQVAPEVELNDHATVQLTISRWPSTPRAKSPRHSAVHPGGRLHTATVPCRPGSLDKAGAGKGWTGNAVRHRGMPIRTCSHRLTGPRLIDRANGSGTATEFARRLTCRWCQPRFDKWQRVHSALKPTDPCHPNPRSRYPQRGPRGWGRRSDRSVYHPCHQGWGIGSPRMRLHTDLFDIRIFVPI